MHPEVHSFFRTTKYNYVADSIRLCLSLCSNRERLGYYVVTK